MRSITLMFVCLVCQASSSPIEPNCVQLCKEIACTGSQCMIECDKVNCSPVRGSIKGASVPLQPRKGEFVCGHRICRLPALELGQSIPGCPYCQVPVKLNYFDVKKHQ